MKAVLMLAWTIVCLLHLIGVGLIAAGLGLDKWGQWAAGVAAIVLLCWCVNYIEKTARSVQS